MQGANAERAKSGAELSAMGIKLDDESGVRPSIPNWTQSVCQMWSVWEMLQSAKSRARGVGERYRSYMLGWVKARASIEEKRELKSQQKAAAAARARV